MLYRISQRSTYRNINTNLSFMTWDMARINNQIATGKKVNKPSDDPSGGALILAMRTILAGIDQYNTDVAVADDWLKSSEAAVQNMKLLLERANVLTEQMSTDTYMPENMDVAAEEVDSLLEGLIKLGNTKIGDRYLFSGQLTEQRPFNDYLTIHDPEADPANDISFTGGFLFPADREFTPRPDLPAVSQQFLAEVTTAGGIDGSSQSSLTIDQTGRDNGLVFQAQPAYAGTGFNIQVEYVDPGAASDTTVTTTDLGGGNYTISVTLGHDGTAVTATAQDVIEAIENDASATPAFDLVTVDLLEGNTGSGLVQPQALTSLTGAVDGAAMFRVSLDGGQTWSVHDAFMASELAEQPLVYNAQLGHAHTTTDFTDPTANVQFTARYPGRAGNDIDIEYQAGGATTVANDLSDPNHPRVIVTLAPGATADDVVAAVDNYVATNPAYMVTASLPDYRVPGTGAVTIPYGPIRLEGADDDVQDLGHATLTAESPNAPEDFPNNLRITALAPGAAGNNIEFRFVAGPTSPGPTQVTDPPVGPNIVQVELETDADGNILATASDVVAAINSYHYDPATTANSLVRAELIPVTTAGDDDPVDAMCFCTPPPPAAPTLSGGDDAVSADNHGVVFRFNNDGSDLTVGDRFYVDVGYYAGDDQDIDVNSNVESRVKTNVTGEDLLGEVAASDNILDMLAGLSYALRTHDTFRVADFLPKIDEGLEKLTTQMSRIGVRLIRNEFTYNVLDSTELSSTERMSREEDVDISEAITALQAKQTAYQATLASISLITKLSLVDYIR